MKKIISILMLISALFLLVACNTENNTSTTTENINHLPNELDMETTTVNPSGEVYQVIINNFKFMPTDLEIKLGDTVEWVNDDYSAYISETDEVDAFEDNGGTPEEREERGTDEGISHTVTFENGDFDQELVPGATASYTFTARGTYRYFCQYHPSMMGTVTVN